VAGNAARCSKSGATPTPNPEFFQIFFVRSRQQIKERIETAIHRAAELRNRPIDRVQRDAARRPIGERQRRILEILQRAFRNEA